ncbi:MAG TPA: hypothetical protein VGW40_10360 [Allosphingosinicella sp.]|nr:hypothetical protein [Allosphingosinicella sp.]
MKTSLKLAVALAVVAGVGATNAIAMQGPQQKQVTYFYDDEYHTNMIGGTLLYCNGSHSHWGSYSIYTEEYYYGCW